MQALIDTAKSGKIDYISIVDALTLESVSQIKRDALVAIAFKFSKARLIDNTILKPNSEK